ncbi:MAG: hypothetical protein ACJ8NR_14885 [Sulfurifustis sp.]
MSTREGRLGFFRIFCSASLVLMSAILVHARDSPFKAGYCGKKAKAESRALVDARNKTKRIERPLRPPRRLPFESNGSSEGKPQDQAIGYLHIAISSLAASF